MKTNKNIYITVLAAVLSASGAHAQTLVNFDDPSVTSLNPVTTQYAAEGVTFSGLDGSGNTVSIDAANNSVFSDVNAYSSPNTLSDFYNGNPYLRAAVMQIDFTSPASDISFEYNPAGGFGVNTVFDAYNTNGTLVDSFSDPSASGDGVWYLESVNLSGISQVDIVSPTPGWGHYIDNLQFTENAASAPDGGLTLGLLGASLGVLAGLRRKLS